MIKKVRALRRHWLSKIPFRMHSLIPDYRRLHAKGKFPGFSIRPYLLPITELVMQSGARTLLDYGSGQGAVHRGVFGTFYGAFGQYCYDPAVKAFDQRRRQFDGVLCIDVLEHIPEHELDEVIADLVGYARMWAFISVCCRPAKGTKRLLDGANVHVTVKEPGWWLEKLGAAFEGRARCIWYSHLDGHHHDRHHRRRFAESPVLELTRILERMIRNINEGERQLTLRDSNCHRGGNGNRGVR